MKVEYDKYYQTENLFGEPYPELLKFYSGIKNKGKLLDLGCGQGRDSIALAKIGYDVTGVDYSKVGIEQLIQIANENDLPIKGIVGDINEFSNFDEFDFILLDSMFHFGKREKETETELLKKIFNFAKPNSLITICIQSIGNKLQILNSIISATPNLKITDREEFNYKFEDKESNHSSVTKYEMVTIKKLKKR